MVKSVNTIKQEIKAIIDSTEQNSKKLEQIMVILEPILKDYELKAKQASDAAWEREAYWQTEGWRKVHEMGEF